MNLRRRLFSQSAIIFGARVFGAGVTFLAQAAIARIWGTAVLGQYLLLIATVNIAAVLMPLGFQTVGTYFAAEYRAKGHRGQLRRFMVRAYGHVVVGAVVLYLVFEAVAGLAGTNGEVLRLMRLPAALFAFATAWIFVNGALLVGLKRPLAGYFAEALVRPLIVVGAFAIALALGEGEPALAKMLWGLALGYLFVAGAQFLWVLSSVGKVAAETHIAPKEARRWWWIAAPWVVIALVTDFFFDLDLFILAGLMNAEELAIFGVATRIFALIAFGVAAVYAVTLPDMFEDAAQSDRAGFLQKVGEANLVATILAMVLFVAAAIGGSLVLMVFGPAFLVGAGPLTVLSFALVVRSALGPASLVLTIHDHPYASLPAVGLGLVTLVIGNYLAVPIFGLMGAAVAALVAISVWSVALWVTVRRIVGIDVSIWPWVLARQSSRAAK